MPRSKTTSGAGKLSAAKEQKRADSMAQWIEEQGMDSFQSTLNKAINQVSTKREQGSFSKSSRPLVSTFTNTTQMMPLPSLALNRALRHPASTTKPLQTIFKMEIACKATCPASLPQPDVPTIILEAPFPRLKRNDFLATCVRNMDHLSPRNLKHSLGKMI